MGVYHFYGKYRAKVVDIKDPEKRGRIRVQCPKVLGDAKSAWCEPCIPVAYDFGGDFAIPKLGEFVWVEFEDGNPSKPIYTGGIWSAEKSPSSDYDVNTRMITWGKCKIILTESSVKIVAPSVTINGRTPAFIGDVAVAENVTGTVTGDVASCGTVTCTIVSNQ